MLAAFNHEFSLDVVVTKQHRRLCVPWEGGVHRKARGVQGRYARQHRYHDGRGGFRRGVPVGILTICDGRGCWEAFRHLTALNFILGLYDRSMHKPVKKNISGAHSSLQLIISRGGSSAGT